MDPHKRFFRNRVVAVEEYHIFSLRHVDADIARGGTRPVAGMVKNPDARLGSRDLTQDLLGPILGILNPADALPVGERLPHHRIQGFPDERFNVTARHDDGKKGFTT